MDDKDIRKIVQKVLEFPGFADMTEAEQEQVAYNLGFGVGGLHSFSESTKRELAKEVQSKAAWAAYRNRNAQKTSKT